jgi:AcrR family transcriptional regulator
MDIRNQILEKAEAFFLRYGLKSVTMDDIARKLCISKKTLYKCVDNKADLISKIVLAHIEKEKAMMEEVHNNSGDAIEEMLKLAKYNSQQMRKLSPTVVYDLQKYYRTIWLSVQNLHMEHGYQLIKENIERGKNQGVYRQDINADILAKIFTISTNSLVDEDLFPLKDYNKENLFLEFIKYHINGIASEKGLKLYKKHTQGNDI